MTLFIEHQLSRLVPELNIIALGEEAFSSAILAILSAAFQYLADGTPDRQEIRVISMRKAEPNEEEIYYANL